MSDDLGPRQCIQRVFGAQIASATGELRMLLLLGLGLFVRVITDDMSATDSRQSGSLNLSAVIALLFILLAAGLLLHRRRVPLSAVLAVLWLSIWTTVAVGMRGASTATLREGVREGSVVALFVLVYSMRGVVTVPRAVRLVQAAGLVPALLALYQLATNGGMDIAGELRANGTFAHPNSAAMFFSIAATASLWCYLENGRHLADVGLAALFASAVLATISIDGTVTLIAMLVALGTLRPGPSRVKLGPCLVAGVIALAFFGTPLGAHRIVKESKTNIASAERGESNSSLAWRLNKWKTLIPEWERAPIAGNGLGTTTTVDRVAGSQFIGELPHNEYIRYLVETGVLGLAILLCGVGILIQRLFLQRRRSAAIMARPLNPATLAIVVVFGCLVNSLADNTLLDSPTCYAATLIVAAVMRLSTVETRWPPTSQAA